MNNSIPPTGDLSVTADPTVAIVAVVPTQRCDDFDPPRVGTVDGDTREVEAWCVSNDGRVFALVIGPDSVPVVVEPQPLARSPHSTFVPGAVHPDDTPPLDPFDQFTYAELREINRQAAAGDAREQRELAEHAMWNRLGGLG